MRQPRLFFLLSALSASVRVRAEVVFRRSIGSGVNTLLPWPRRIKAPHLPAAPGWQPAEGPLSPGDGAESLYFTMTEYH